MKAPTEAGREHEAEDDTQEAEQESTDGATDKKPQGIGCVCLYAVKPWLRSGHLAEGFLVLMRKPVVGPGYEWVVVYCSHLLYRECPGAVCSLNRG
jgi:hypothetical protein